MTSPLDYLTIGHIACDRTPNGSQLGGTVTYASLTASTLGQRVGIVTATGRDVTLDPIHHLPRAGHRVQQSTTFENITTPAGRVQTIHALAPPLTPDLIPSPWKTTPIVHLGPIVHEITPTLLDEFPNTFIGLTPQGWLRQWDDKGHVSPGDWLAWKTILPKVTAAVLSIEDIAQDETRIGEMASVCPILVVTEGRHGARVFQNGLPTHIPAPSVPEVDATGAGDIFAAAFFIHLHQTHDPLEAAHFATHLAARSVTRPGLSGIPTAEEINAWEREKIMR